VVAKAGERLAVSKTATHECDMGRLILNEAEGKEQYHVKISDRFAVFENLDDDGDDGDINRT
jgi:hypothetical protein